MNLEEGSTVPSLDHPHCRRPQRRAGQQAARSSSSESRPTRALGPRRRGGARGTPETLAEGLGVTAQQVERVHPPGIGPVGVSAIGPVRRRHRRCRRASPPSVPSASPPSAPAALASPPSVPSASPPSVPSASPVAPGKTSLGGAPAARHVLVVDGLVGGRRHGAPVAALGCAPARGTYPRTVFQASQTGRVVVRGEMVAGC